MNLTYKQSKRNKSFKKILLYLFFLLITMSSVYLISLQTGFTDLKPNTFTIGKNSETDGHLYLTKGTFLLISFNSSQNQPLYITVMKDTDYQAYFHGGNEVTFIYSDFKSVLVNQSIYIFESAIYYIVFFNYHYSNNVRVANEETTITYKISILHSPTQPSISIPSSDLVTTNMVQKGSVPILLFCIILLILPLIVFFNENREFITKHKSESEDSPERIQIWKTSPAIKLLGILVIILITFINFILFLGTVKLKYMGWLGLALFFSMSNFLVSRRFIYWSVNRKTNETIFYYHLVLTGIFFLLTVISTQFNILIKSVLGLYNFIGILLLQNSFTPNPDNEMYVIVILLIPFILLFLFLLYQILFTEKTFLDLSKSIVSLETKIMFIPLILTQDIPLREFTKGKVVITNTKMGIICSLMLTLETSKKTKLIKQGTQKEVYDTIHKILTVTNIPIEEKKRSFLSKSSKTTLLTKDILEEKYPILKKHN